MPAKENMTDQFFSESAVATFIITPNHEVIFWNKACEELTGVKASQVIFTDMHWTAFYKEKRPCLVDILITGQMDQLKDLYVKYGRSKLSPNGINAEGWYEDLGGKKRYIIFDAVPIFNDTGELIAAMETLNDITEQKTSEKEKEELLEILRTNIATSKLFKGFIPICSSCKNVRTSEGEWTTIEEYFHNKLHIRFSHGICPECIRKLYPGFYDRDK